MLETDCAILSYDAPPYHKLPILELKKGTDTAELHLEDGGVLFGCFLVAKQAWSPFYQKKL